MKKAFLSLIVLFSCIYLNAGEPVVRVASYNIRYDNKGDSLNGNGWKQRCPVIVSMILFYDFDLIGTQECKNNQIEDLTRSLPGYASIGVGREDGKTEGEFSAIFYKKDRFEVVEQGNFWLSETPGLPSKGWDAALNRICTWGKFKDKSSGKRFCFFNLHMDHIGVEARKNSARLVLDKIKEMKDKYPVILSGDFNVDQNNESYILLDSSGILKDSYHLAQIRYAENGTFNSFRPDMKTDSRIDHIFVSKQFSVLRYAILPNVYWSEKPANDEIPKANDAPQEISFRKYEVRLPSDHFPVVVDFKYQK
jgi:endonuclease/exonuclease/phosphatase family metal-dependent hydrolase